MGLHRAATDLTALNKALTTLRDGGDWSALVVFFSLLQQPEEEDTNDSQY